MNEKLSHPYPDSPTGAISRRSFVGASAAAMATATAAASASAAISIRAEMQPSIGLPDGARPRQSLTMAQAAVKAIQPTVVRISREVWDKPAVGLKEHEAMEVHIRELAAAGFTIVSREPGGHPTAFIVEWSHGKGGPKIGFLPEYDALPGLGNAAEPELKPAPNGLTDGHGCGHNSLGAGCTGAAIALKAMMLQRNVPGTLRLYGCGAEENVGAKIFLAKEGLFDDLDAALAWHPASVPVTGTFVTNANEIK